MSGLCVGGAFVGGDEVLQCEHEHQYSFIYVIPFILMCFKDDTIVIRRKLNEIHCISKQTKR